jgi:hypothetical protein
MAAFPGSKPGNHFKTASHRAQEKDMEKANVRESKLKMNFHFRGNANFRGQILLAHNILSSFSGLFIFPVNFLSFSSLKTLRLLSLFIF